MVVTLPLVALPLVALPPVVLQTTKALPLVADCVLELTILVLLVLVVTWTARTPPEPPLPPSTTFSPWTPPPTAQSQQLPLFVLSTPITDVLPLVASPVLALPPVLFPETVAFPVL